MQFVVTEVKKQNTEDKNRVASTTRGNCKLGK